MIWLVHPVNTPWKAAQVLFYVTLYGAFFFSLGIARNQPLDINTLFSKRKADKDSR